MDVNSYSSDILKELNVDDTYYVTLLLLALSNDNPKYSTISELAYILDHDNFINFIKYFEGQTITIPKIDNIIESLKLLLVFQYNIVEKKPIEEAIKLAGYDMVPEGIVVNRLNKYISEIYSKDYKLGGIFNDGYKK
jgi:hypothetical protein